ncbi:monooxygenase [Xylaria palmicola]|nr:monooxygenase [Xylaria palmicola]
MVDNGFVTFDLIYLFYLTPILISPHTPMSRSRPAPIAIVGGGPCGLTLARLLELAGIDYVVFERDASAAPNRDHQGGSLDLHPGTGLAALQAAGLMDEFEKFARREADVFTVQDCEGRSRYTTENEGSRPEIDRHQLRDILLASVPASRIRWGKMLKTVENGGAPGTADWVLRFADGSSESGFRLVVGADGAWSKVRPLVMTAKPKYSGRTYVEGRLSRANPRYAAALEMVGPGNSAAIGAGRVLVVQQMADRTYRIYAGVEEPESLAQPGGVLDFTTADIEKSRTALLGFFADWAPHLRAFIEDAEGPWRVWPLHTFDTDVFSPEAEGKTWVHAPRVTLIGDAAHVALPNGEGVNQAMLDALKLFECLSAESDERQGEPFDPEADAAAVDRAIVAYEGEMRIRAREHIEDGLMTNEMMYAADGAERMIAMFKQFAQEASES